MTQHNDINDEIPLLPKESLRSIIYTIIKDSLLIMKSRLKTFFGCSAIKRIGKSVLWIVLTLFFGFYQTWINLIMVYLDNVKQNYTLIDIAKEGVLLFFSMVLIASLTIDHHIFRKTYQSDFINSFMFIFVPVVMFSTCITLFFSLRLAKSPNYDAIIHIHIAILIFTIIYGIIIKFFSE